MRELQWTGAPAARYRNCLEAMAGLVTSGPTPRYRQPTVPILSEAATAPVSSCARAARPRRQ
jgi:hypothetical protein